MYKVNSLLLMAEQVDTVCYEQLHTAAEVWWVNVFSGQYAMVEVIFHDRKILAWDCSAGLPRVTLLYGNVKL